MAKNDRLRIVRDSLFFTGEALAAALLVLLATGVVTQQDDLVGYLVIPSSITNLILLTGFGLGFASDERFRGWLERREIVSEALQVRVFYATKVLALGLAGTGALLAHRADRTAALVAAGLVAAFALFQLWRGQSEE